MSEEIPLEKVCKCRHRTCEHEDGGGPCAWYCLCMRFRWNRGRFVKLKKEYRK